MKKIILSILGVFIMSGFIGGSIFHNLHIILEQERKEKNATSEIMEIKQEIDSEKVMDEEETKMSEQKEDIKVEQVSKTESKNEILQPKKETTNNTSSASKNEEKTKTNAIKNNSISAKTQQSNNTTPKQNNSTQNNQQNVQQNVVSTTFYDSITGGKREFSSESEAFARGTEIQNKELDYVLDWNETHPDNQIQPDINYFRVYPSVIDENGKYWYYLHFFCQSGEGNDAKLKSKF